MSDPTQCPPGPEPDPRRIPAYKVEGDADTGWVGGSSSSSANDDFRDNTEVTTFTFDELSILCHDIGLSPEMIDGVVAQLLTNHFKDPSWLIHQEELGRYQWRPGKDTGIHILPVDEWNEVQSSKIPAIIYADLGQTPSRISIGDQFYHSAARPEALGYARAYSGSHRVMCVGDNQRLASLLATETSKWLSEFSPWLVRNLPFHDFQVAAREAPQMFTGLGDRIGVALVLTYSYIWAWELVPDGPPLKSVTLTIRR